MFSAKYPFHQHKTENNKFLWIQKHIPCLQKRKAIKLFLIIHNQYYTPLQCNVPLGVHVRLTGLELVCAVDV